MIWCVRSFVCVIQHGNSGKLFHVEQLVNDCGAEHGVDGETETRRLEEESPCLPSSVTSAFSESNPVGQVECACGAKHGEDGDEETRRLCSDASFKALSPCLPFFITSRALAGSSLRSLSLCDLPSETLCVSAAHVFSVADISPTHPIRVHPCPSVVKECSTWNNGRGLSPSCRKQTLKLQLEALRRGGVPVLRRISLKPRASRLSESRLTAGRPSPPLSRHWSPIQTRPRKAVPLVMTTVRAVRVPWHSVRTKCTEP